MTARRTIHLCQRGLPAPLTCLACGEIAQRAERGPLPSRQPAICTNANDWATIYLNHSEYRRCIDAPDKRDAPPKRFPTPTRRGFYWAEWRVVEPGTFPENPDWEEHPVDALGSTRVVEVYARMNDLDDDTLLVDVTGVDRPQAIDNFVWRSARLEAP